MAHATGFRGSEAGIAQLKITQGFARDQTSKSNSPTGQSPTLPRTTRSCPTARLPTPPLPSPPEMRRAMAMSLACPLMAVRRQGRGGACWRSGTVCLLTSTNIGWSALNTQLSRSRGCHCSHSLPTACKTRRVNQLSRSVFDEAGPKWALVFMVTHGRLLFGQRRAHLPGRSSIVFDQISSCSALCGPSTCCTSPSSPALQSHGVLTGARRSPLVVD